MIASFSAAGYRIVPQCWIRRADHPARYGSSLQPNIASASLGGCPSQPVLTTCAALGFLSHLRSPYGYDEPEILLPLSHRFCPMSADAGQAPAALLSCS